MNNRFFSRKFLLVLAGVAGIGAAAYTGQMEWPSAIEKIVYLVLAYVGVEGAADFQRARTKPE